MEDFIATEISLVSQNIWVCSSPRVPSGMVTAGLAPVTPGLSRVKAGSPDPGRVLSFVSSLLVAAEGEDLLLLLPLPSVLDHSSPWEGERSEVKAPFAFLGWHQILSLPDC